MMNFTVSSAGDPHRDSCAKLGEANPPRNNSASQDAGIIDANFIALGSLPYVFHRHRRASLFFASNQDALDSLREIEEWSALGSPRHRWCRIRQSSILPFRGAVFPASDDSN